MRLNSHSHELFNNPYPGQNNSVPPSDIYFFTIYSIKTIVILFILRSRSRYLTVKHSKVPAASSVLVIYPTQLSLLNFIILTILGDLSNYEVPHFSKSLHLNLILN